MHGVFYTITLQEPVVANHLGGDNNSARSLPYIPGSLVRGTVIGVFLREKGLSELDAADAETRRLFFDGATRYLHAYRWLPRESQRTLPEPLSWRKGKNAGQEEAQRFDFSAQWPDDEEQYIGLKEDRFCWFRSGTASSFECLRQIAVHTQRNAEAGRALEGSGAVFRYEALPPYTLWAGAVLTADDDDAAQILAWLDGATVELGKSRSAGYGRARVQANLLADDWREYGLDRPAGSDDDEGEEEVWLPDTPAVTNEFTLTFLSEALLRDDNGQFTPDPLPALRRLFPKPKIDLLQHQSAAENSADFAFRQAAIVGGFNRKWGLPLPQTTAVAAGSVFRLTAEPPLTEEQIRQLEEHGLGARRAEGFGRVAINWHIQPTLSWREDSNSPPAPPSVQEHSAEDEKLALFIAQRLVQRRLDDALRRAIASLKIEGPIPNSQLSRWRNATRSAQAEPKPERKLERLTILYRHEQDKNSAAWKRMYRARIGKQRLTDWLWQILTDPKAFWKAFNDSGDTLVCKLGPVTYNAQEDAELAVTYRLRLVDGVLARKAQEQAGAKKKGGRS